MKKYNKQHRKVTVALQPLPDPKQFWLVCISHENNILTEKFRPSVKHPTARAAGEEARRLALRFKTSFVVLEVVGSFDKDGNLE